ncbi:putative protein OS=Streptomyces griseomycini OX=66895 GN=FHS37_005757 PE=4 SV=1 [Streptomyces griseomycini]|uniref:Uncharacterized protein n=1 Tax=Streptomyces griseomycini TaxID=66895 RepID=A0A7W7PUT1_9ACTN|nr:hypothetical protein [Streptomyces griseomycini]
MEGGRAVSGVAAAGRAEGVGDGGEHRLRVADDLVGVAPQAEQIVHPRVDGGRAGA